MYITFVINKLNNYIFENCFLHKLIKYEFPSTNVVKMRCSKTSLQFGNIEIHSNWSKDNNIQNEKKYYSTNENDEWKHTWNYEVLNINMSDRCISDVLPVDAWVLGEWDVNIRECGFW